MKSPIPLSVKFPDPTRRKLKRVAQLLDTSENKVVNDSVEAILDMIDSPDHETVPKVVLLARQAGQYEERPPLLARHVRKTHSD